MHNGRLLLSPLPTTAPDSSAAEGVVSASVLEPLHELDLVLLSSVERAKTAGSSVASLLTDKKTAVDGGREEEEDSAADTYVQTRSFILLLFCLSTHSVNTFYQQSPSTFMLVLYFIAPHQHTILTPPLTTL